MKILIICKDYITPLQFLKSSACLHELCVEIAMITFIEHGLVHLLNSVCFVLQLSKCYPFVENEAVSMELNRLQTCINFYFCEF